MRTSTVFETPFSVISRPEKVRDFVRFEFQIYSFFLILLDLVLTILAFRVSYLLRFQAGIPFFQDSIVPEVAMYSDFMLLVSPIWPVVFAFLGLYKRVNLLGGTREYELLFNGNVLGMFIIISLGFLFPTGLILARGWVILAFLLSLAFTATGRFLLRHTAYSLRKHGHLQEPTLIVGANEEAQLLSDQLMNWQSSGVRLIGYAAQSQCSTLATQLKRLGTVDEIEDIIAKHGISEIILITSALNQEQILMLFRKFGTRKEITLRMTSGLYEIISTGISVKTDGLVPLMTIDKVRMTGSDQFFKLMMDYFIAIPLTILLLPLFGLLALAVKLDSRGPAFYRRRVMGVNGHQFDAFKFRTMHTNSDEILEANPALMEEYLENFKLKDDPRITRIGRFLRKTSLDELPQIINVLLNQMSLVGPRMICPQELNKYNQWDINLLTVKPGITGLWQVRGRSEVSYEERVRMDMFYIRNWTIWLDIQLLLQTVPAVLSRRGAY